MKPALSSLLHVARRAGETLGPRVVLIGIAFVAWAVLTLAPPLLPPGALLPAVVLALFIAACVAALVAGHRANDPRRHPHLTYWDVAGLLTLIGAGLSAAVEPEQMVRLVETARREP